MVETVVAFIVDSLGDLLIQEAEALHGVSHHVEELHDGLKSLQCFLKAAEAKQKEHDVRLWMADVRELAYDASDVLENFVVKVASTERRKVGRLKDILNKYVCSLDEVLAVSISNTISRIQAVKTRISDLTTRSQLLGLRSIPLSGSLSTFGTNTRETNQDYYIHSVVDQQLVIGLEEDIKDLVARLVNEGNDNMCRVVGIYGMGGLGKTTLASKVYNHPSIKSHFACFAWVCVSQKWRRIDILRDMLIKLSPVQRWDEVIKLSEDELVNMIFEIQNTRSCLLVLDDIWSNDVWGCLKAAFPARTGSPSKILLTTRIKQVAENVADSDSFLHQPKLLDEDQSWELLLRKTCINKIVGAAGSINVDQMEVLGREMLRHCNGLPLGILVLGGILVTKPTLIEWERVHQNVMSHVKMGKGMGQEHRTEVLQILELSYQNLPYQLKLCFLHLGQFPEDSEIETEKLYQMWMAEGFILSKDRREEDGQTMLSVAERYLSELAHRSMVLVQSEEEEPSLRKFKSCHLHDLMRDLSLQKADDEKFFRALQRRASTDQQQLVTESSSETNIYTRRVVICHGVESIFNRKDCFLNNKVITKRLRSLICDWKMEVRLYHVEKSISELLRYNLHNFKLLRVLALEKILIDEDNEQKVMDTINNLANLRYLSLRDSHICIMHVMNLGYLQTVDLRVSSIWKAEKVVLGNFSHLQHLHFPSNRDRAPGPGTRILQLSHLTNLETVENFDPSWCETRDLYGFSNLKKLKISVTDGEIEDVEEIINYLTSTSASSLIHSSLYIMYLQSITAFVNHVDHLSSLTVLSLYRCSFNEHPMAVFEKIPNLRRLTLDSCEVGQHMLCSATGFPQLRKLTLDTVLTLRSWTVEQGAMANLCYLEIRHCFHLKMLPDGLRFLTTLQELKISQVTRAFMRRIKVVDGQEGEDFYKIRHIPSISLS